MATDTKAAPAPSLAEIGREWGRIGTIGFGGPPAHIALLRSLCVERRGWLSDEEFEQALAAANLLPGPASTQLCIYCAWRLRGPAGAIVGGLGFILPGLVAIVALAAAFLSGSPPRWLLGAGAGAGAAIAPVAARTGLVIAAPIWARAAAGRAATASYLLVGGLAAALAGPWLVLVLLACGVAQLARSGAFSERARTIAPVPVALLAVAPAGAGAVAWTAFKVGALAFGGGFVIVPLMQSDAVSTYHWMTHAQFLDAVALGQVTPGPVVHTVTAVGYAAGGVAGALLAAAVAFAPSFAFVLVGGPRWRSVLAAPRARAFVAGAAPAAAGAIIGSVVPLAAALSEGWQAAVLGGAALALLAFPRALVMTLLACGLAGAVAVAVLGAPLPR